MGHRNIQFMRSMIDLEADQDPGLRHPDPCIFYANVPNFQQPNLQPLVPTPGSQCNFNIHPIPEHRDNAVFYSMPPYNGIQPQYPVANLDLAIAAPSGHHNPYLAPPSGTRDFPVQVNHGALDLANSANYFPLEFGGNDPASIVEHGSLASARNRASMVGVQSVQAHNANHVIQGNYTAPSIQLPGNPWLDSNFSANSGDIGTFAWPQSRNLPYGHASANGACVEAGVQGYQIRAINRGPSGFMHPPYVHGHPNHYHPAQPMQVMSVNHPSQVATSSRRMPTNSVSNTGLNSTLDVVDGGPTFLAPVPPTGFRFYRPQRREFLLDPNFRHRNLPHLRVLPEDGVAMLEIPGYHGVGDTIDQHRDLRLDIDRMSYEELIALGEQMGSVGTGLSEEFIQNKLKVRTFTLLHAGVNLEATNDQKRIDFCVVCQTVYESEEKIGTLECGHEYHRDCIKKWLLMKNTCPVCKSPGLSGC